MTPEADALLEAARAAGALEAEVFSKSGHGRKLALEPGLHPGASPLQTVSHWEEEGMALRIVDREGRRGFAWIGLPALARPRASLLEAALASARLDAGEAGRESRALGPGPWKGGPRPELKLADPECMSLPAERIAALLGEAAAGAGGSPESAAIDRLALSEATTTISLANSHGFSGSYTKSLVFLSVGLIPESPGGAAVVEERSACRLADLDAQDCVREAMLRAAPARQPIPAPAGDPAPLLLTPRASASLMAALLPWVIPGEPAIWRGSALRIVDDPTLAGRPGSAPFDGAGFETRRTILIEAGSAVGRLSPERGNLLRPSYRDLPEIGPSGLLIEPAEGAPATSDGGTETDGDAPVLRVSAVEVVPGEVWVLRLRRADWWAGGKPLGPADGLAWEGPPALIFRGLSAAGTEVKFYHCGLPLGTPGLRIDGLSPLRFEAPGRSATSL